MAGQIEAYRKEIFDFLRTVTIKFEPFAYLMGQEYMSEHGIIDPNGEWNPYYQNLAGQYSENDTRMEVYSVETEEMVPFDRDLATKYPKTASLYKVTRTEYTILEEQYPENRGLIRTIAYPIPDIKTAIEAENLSLLAYDDSLLDVNERYDLVNCLKEFLHYMRERWWVYEYCYENMYAVTFWILLWQQLPLVLLTRRFQNIRTPYAHTFHIWEYLKSKGMKDYRDVLTNQQALWLYRNMEWVLGNQGKNETLLELADNLLEEISVSINYKDMYQETDTRWDEAKTTPNFITEGLLNGERSDVETTEDLNNRLVESGLETETGADYIDQLEDLLSKHPHNILPTKLLEFKKDPINTSNEQLMCNFFVNTLAYRLSQNQLSYTVNLKDPYTGTVLELFVGDVALLWSYALYRSIGRDPVYTPNKFICYLPFKKDQVLISDLRPSIWYNQHKYYIKNLVDLDWIANTLAGDWHPRTFTDSEDWINTLANQFRNLLAMRRYYEQSNDYLFHKAMNSVFEDLRYEGTASFNVTPYKTYAEFFSANALLKEVMDTYETITDKDNYFTNLATVCFDTLFPLTEVMLDEFVGTLRNLETIYNSVRDLFIQLCSYNVTFLETERDRNYYLNYRDPDFVAPTEVLYYAEHLLDFVKDDYNLRYKMINYLNRKNLIYDVRINQGSTGLSVAYYPRKLNIEYLLKHKLQYEMKHSTVTNKVSIKSDPVIYVKFKINTDAVSFKQRG